MNIIVVDDERLALKDLVETVGQVFDEAYVQGFQKPAEALLFAEEAPVNIAFLDVEMGGMDGISLARQLSALQPGINIIFVTGFAEYALDAFEVFASGYVLKPVTAGAISRSVQNLRHPLPPSGSDRLLVQTFGNFEVLIKGEPLHFYRSKAKELFAYLVLKRGTGCTVRELCAVLYGDREYTRSLGNQMQTLISSLIKTLSEAGWESVVERSFNSLALHPELLDCDYYAFLAGDQTAARMYVGEFMSNYEWAETANAHLAQKAGGGQ